MGEGLVLIFFGRSDLVRRVFFSFGEGGEGCLGGGTSLFYVGEGGGILLWLCMRRRGEDLDLPKQERG